MKPLTQPMKACALLPPDIEHSDENILAALKQLHYPVYATEKVDGIRAVRTTDLFSCRMKLIPNIEIRRRTMMFPYGFDMELYNPDLSYDQIESIVMSEVHSEHNKIQFHLLDWYGDEQYQFRIANLHQMEGSSRCQNIVFPQTYNAHNADQLFLFFLNVEQTKGEGICFRTPQSPYKQGRSTLKEQYLIKFCRYIREEVTIIGFEEQMMNNNRAKRSPTGFTERSSRQHNLMPKGTLGALLIRYSSGQEGRVGTGFSEAKRQEIWDNQEMYLGKMGTVKHKPIGAKDKPRHPVWCGMREEGY